MSATTASTQALPHGDTLLGLAALGKTAFALLLVVGLIVLFAWLMRRLTPGHAGAGQHLRIVASRALGPKERVVIVELEDTWLVLGVAGGQVTKLDQRAAPATPPADAQAHAGGFAARFAQALKHTARPGDGPRP